MIWDNSHWVGLAINLELWDIEILDSNQYKNDGFVREYMRPVVEMLPYIVRKLCGPRATQSHGVKPFTWQRTQGLYSNDRSGDCGPLAAKFMEMHALGASSGGMDSLTDEVVDNLRKQYAVDIYKECIVPLYSE
ncbi:hypothetical protein LUZ61_023110 [Rhynchospora tenuis]|uniref:Ubiquitin-like protease family profile domain-containing protein n=1 Tax=Rhynchospora tenuis TaxID=198213 RepID=A0AAD5W541_9POAL|nr:hypothetical protein LUZ61_023110 [Rhynchospora tenuis]